MDAFTVLVAVTLILICMCCIIYISKHIADRIACLVRIVKSELDDREP